MDNRSFLTVLVRGMALLKTCRGQHLGYIIYLSLNYKIRLRQHISEHIRQRILLINKPEPEHAHMSMIWPEVFSKCAY